MRNSINKIAFLYLIGLFMLMALPCYAGTASVIITGPSEGRVNIVVRNISDNKPADGGLITWSDISAGENSWKIANQYIEISHEDLPEFWGIQIYTDNKNESVNPKYTGTANPAGLIKSDNTMFSLPMAWKITASVISSPQDPEQRADGTGFSNYAWHFLKDKNTFNNPDTDIDESFQNGEEYITLWNQSGIGWNEGARSGNPQKAYIYLASNFTMSSAGAEYATSALTIEAYRGISPFPIYIYSDGGSLENHFVPSGWMGSISVDTEYTESLREGSSSCFKISWDGKGGFAGLAWQEPENEWFGGPGKGYDLRGAQILSFWARTDDFSYEGAAHGKEMKIGVYFGNLYDSCERSSTSTFTLSTEWNQYTIFILDSDMSHVSNGFTVELTSNNTARNDNKCNIYIDDIKYDRY